MNVADVQVAARLLQGKPAREKIPFQKRLFSFHHFDVVEMAEIESGRALNLRVDIRVLPMRS